MRDDEQNEDGTENSQHPLKPGELVHPPGTQCPTRDQDDPTEGAIPGQRGHSKAED
jgi:hypothetical protein